MRINGDQPKKRRNLNVPLNDKGNASEPTMRTREFSIILQID
jgi:hypothetical protein